MRFRFWGAAGWLAVVVSSLVGCATQPRSGPPPAAPSGSFSESGDGLGGGLRFGDSVISHNAIDGLLAAEEVPAAASRARMPKTSMPKKGATDRPGLATQAGADTWSVVNDLSFYRKPGGQPDAVDSFHYNDAVGAKSMAEALGGGKKKGGEFAAAGDRLAVSVRSGSWDRPLERYEAAGRKIVIGAPGQAYEIVLRNKTDHAVEVVASVDGLDVVDGKPAAVQKRGYIVAAGSTLAVEGFRKDRRTVKRFVFGSVDASAAAKAGQSRNVGVIGLAVYDEDEAQARAARLAEARQRQNASAFPGGGR